MSRPVSFADTWSFMGEERTFTRQRFYRYDDADFNAAMYDERTDEPPPLSSSYYTIDSYGELAEPVPETTANIDRFRSDVASDKFRSMLEERRIGDDADDGSLRPRSFPERLIRQRRALMLEAMRKTNAQMSLFSVNYAACVPPQFIREFLSSVEVSAILAALLPVLLVRDESLKYHLEEEHWRRIMADAGATYKRAETKTLAGHLRVLAPRPPGEQGWYTHEVVESSHAHCKENKTVLRILVFQIYTSAAATRADDGTMREVENEADAGYYVRLIFHLVNESAATEKDAERHNVVCFRTFHFAREL